MPLKWNLGTDNNGNDRFNAESGLFDDPAVFPDADPEPLHWVISASLRDNCVAWTLYQSDSELLNQEDCLTVFRSLAAAQKHCERREAELLAKA